MALLTFGCRLLQVPVSSRVLFRQGQQGGVRMWSKSALHDRLIRAATTTDSSMETFYADSGIDRCTELRLDSKWISEALSHPKTVIVPILGSKNIVKSDRAVLVSPNELDAEVRDSKKVVFLGLNTENIPVFAADVKDVCSSDAEWLKDGEWVDLRRYGPELQSSDAGLLAYARGMVEWNSKNNFCCLCGSRMISNHAGHSLKCASSTCQHSVYPRLDPAIIVLVTSGKYILLGRQSKWERGRYSLLAGFVEVGETFEQAVVREVKEESDVDVELSSIKYVANQPWPFPSSLMIGFVGEAKCNINVPKPSLSEDEVLAGVSELESLTRIVTRSGELEDARWIHQDFLKDVLRESAQCKFSVPGKHAIARFLMERWIESDTDDNWAGKDVQTTVIDEGKFKYVLIRLKDAHGNQKLVVRGNKDLPFHVNILEAFQQQVQPLGLQVEPMGGGKMEHSPEAQSIHIFGQSQAYGPANHKLTSSLVSRSFPLYNVHASID